MEKLYAYLPQDFVNFVLVTLFALLIGLSQRRIALRREGETTVFGTDRTFTFIGILGYLLYILSPDDFTLFIGGGAIVGLLLATNYLVKQLRHDVYGVTSIVIALITYCLAPIVYTQPSWLSVTVVVAVLMLAEMKHTFTELVQRMNNDEMLTLAKFLAIAGIVLPMLPDKPFVAGVSLTPYSIWLATVVVSGISYFSYLLRRYVFKEAGIMVSGLLGGLYSSTATIIVLARNCKTAAEGEKREYIAAMLMSVAMMFLRFLFLAAIFSKPLLGQLYPYLLVMCAVTAATSVAMHLRWRHHARGGTVSSEETSNPLEFKVALIFALLFVVFTFATHFTYIYFGDSGVNVLSFVSGVSDITPFVLNLFGNANLGMDDIVRCSLQAMLANVAVNMVYAYLFSGKSRKTARIVFGSFGLILVLGGGVLAAAWLIA